MTLSRGEQAAEGWRLDATRAAHAQQSSKTGAGRQSQGRSCGQKHGPVGKK